MTAGCGVSVSAGKREEVEEKNKMKASNVGRNLRCRGVDGAPP